MTCKLVWTLAFTGAMLTAGTVAAQQFRGYGDGYGSAPYGEGGRFDGGYTSPGYDPYDAPRRARGERLGAYNNDPDPGEPGYRPRPGRDRADRGQAGRGADRLERDDRQGFYNNDPGEPSYRPRGGQAGPGPEQFGRDGREQEGYGGRGFGNGPYGYGGGPYGYGYDQGPGYGEPEGAREPGRPAGDYDLGENANRTTVTEVANTTHQPPGTIVIDTQERHLYFTQANGQALQYGIGVGREGFTWKGTAQVKRKSEWPAWVPPSDMLKRRPDLPTRMEGGIENPLGARALYLFNGKGDTGYRIHGTNEPDTIGKAVSSGCIRMMNADVIDLYRRVPVGTKVVVL